MRAFAYAILALLAACQTPIGPRSLPVARCDTSAAREDVGRTIQSFYDALGQDDAEAFRRLTTPGFAAFEVGKRYSGVELRSLIAKSRAEGRVIRWGLGPMTFHVDCAIAAASWENNGSVSSSGKTQRRTWLESAVLQRYPDGWRIVFLHSTPKDPRG